MALDNETANKTHHRLVAPVILYYHYQIGWRVVYACPFALTNCFSFFPFEFEFQRPDQIITRQEIGMVGNVDKCRWMLHSVWDGNAHS